MKPLLSLFAAVIVGLSVVCLVQSRKIASLQSRTAESQAALDQKATQVEELQAGQQRLRREQRELFVESEALAARLSARAQAAQDSTPSRTSAAHPDAALSAEAGPATNSDSGFGQMLSKMMQDPDTRKMIRDQQRLMMNQLYGPLIKQLGLSPAQADQFKTLLADNAATAADQAASMFGANSQTNRQDATKAIEASQKNLDDQLKNLLGNDGFAQYKTYQQTAGERMQLNLFQQQMATDNPLTDTQTEQLLSFMKQERDAATAAGAPAPPGAGQDKASLEAMFSGDQADKLLESQQTVNSRVFDRAQSILSPDQLDAFGKFQTNQLQMMRLGMTMARKMFNPNSSVPAPTPQ
jgi:hypothetical protein